MARPVRIENFQIADTEKQLLLPSEGNERKMKFVTTVRINISNILFVVQNTQC